MSFQPIQLIIGIQSSCRSRLCLTEIQPIYFHSVHRLKKTDDLRWNISHFLLRYIHMYVNPFRKEGELDKRDFCSFNMDLASQYVKSQISQGTYSTNELMEVLESVEKMFLDDTKERPYMIEILVLQALLNNRMEWRASS